MLEKKRFIIIGAGPTGLGAAYRLKELGVNDFLVLEQNNIPGGLARSFVDPHGFTWDIGGHVQFSHYAYFDDLMKKALGVDGWYHHQRESWAVMHDRFVPYPVQNNIRHLPQEVMWKCLEGLIELYRRPPQHVPKNFHEWILQTFGQGLAEVFMLPYNFKVWAYEPQHMSSTWVGERVAVADLLRVTKNIVFENDDVSWGPNNTFQFPKVGGTGSIWAAVARLIGESHFRFGASVARVDTTKKLVTTSSGEQFGYDALISTMPIDVLSRSVGDDGPLQKAASQLKFSSTHIVGLGLKGAPKESLRGKCWLYFPEANCPFYRATLFSHYSPAHVPSKNHWSLMTETSESSHKPVDAQKLVDDTINGALATKLIESKDHVVSTWSFRANHGYPTPSIDRDVHLKIANASLEKLDVFSRGRFGGWKYEVSNQDHSMMQGVEIVNRLVLKVPETTLPFCATANANWGK